MKNDSAQNTRPTTARERLARDLVVDAPIPYRLSRLDTPIPYRLSHEGELELVDVDPRGMVP